MKRSSIIIPLLLIITAGIIAFVCIITGYDRRPADSLMYNDIAQTVRENFDRLDALDSIEFDTDFCVYDPEGFLLYPKDSRYKNLPQAVNEGYITIPVHDGSRFMGTAAIPDPERVSYDMTVRKLIAALIVLILCFFAAMAVYTVYVDRNVIKPFAKMQDFAGRIATGKLDEPLMIEKNNVFGIFTESFDIMREELLAARKRENDLKIKEKELVAQLSHDLKTPLTGINTICEVLSVKTNDDYTLGKVHDIQNKTHQMDMLVTDLFTAALDDLGEMSVTCTDESSAVLPDIVLANDPRMLTRSDTVPECLISIDKQRMSQIVGNIIGNSYKYADTPIDVRYSLSGDYLRMSFTDHGKGVPEDELGLITNKFYRGRDVRSSDKGGSGLGLYISAELTARMNGELICSSNGEGLTVTLLIPLS
ncbi:MAG: HAMP domain-containing histidine kinase [Oscillospiraceae bacterium]|nr:HAMP domain-containing histidine kinase [Oscillospiraceae bacterium]